MNRTKRAALARETLDIVERGSYVAPDGITVDISTLVEFAVENTITVRPVEFDGLSVDAPPVKTVFEVTNETTLSAARRFAGENAVCLNFASATNPGGGFLDGSRAQEESLAMSSALYATLVKDMEMYEYNRPRQGGLYSDYMIYSPRVPVFRDDDGKLLSRPYTASFITSPAVNVGALRAGRPGELEQADSVMHARSRKLLSLALDRGHRVFVLGAWGCGVFRNKPDKVADIFHRLLVNGEFRGKFGRIVFAVLDRSTAGAVYETFRRRFADTTA